MYIIIRLIFILQSCCVSYLRLYSAVANNQQLHDFHQKIYFSDYFMLNKKNDKRSIILCKLSVQNSGC